MAEPDLLAMAESGLLGAVVGEWEISHDTETAVWGRAVVKGLKDGVILTNAVQPCTFGFRHRSRPQPKDIYTSAVTIHWSEASYATLESFGEDFLKWRLPTQDDGTAGSYTVWRRMRVDASKDQAAEEVIEVRARAADELADVRAQAEEELAEVRVRAADQVTEARSKAAIEIAALHAKAAAELAEMRAKAAVSEELAEARAKATLANELEEARAKAALSGVLAEERANIADEIAVENESLRVQLNTQAASSESLRDQLKSLRMLIVEMMAQSVPSKSSLFKELLEEKSWHPAGSKCVRQQEGTPDKELPMEKRRRTDAVGNESETLGYSLISCGA